MLHSHRKIESSPLDVGKFGCLHIHPLLTETKIHINQLTKSVDFPRSTVCWAGKICTVNASMTLSWISNVSLPSVFEATQRYTPASVRLISFRLNVPLGSTKIRFCWWLLLCWLCFIWYGWCICWDEDNVMVWCVRWAALKSWFVSYPSIGSSTLFFRMCQLRINI